MRISYLYVVHVSSLRLNEGGYHLRPTEISRPWFLTKVHNYQKFEEWNTVAYWPPKNVFSLIPLSIKCFQDVMNGETDTKVHTSCGRLYVSSVYAKRSENRRTV